MAGGQWKRLEPITKQIPKPMVKLLNKPILEYIINWVYNKVDEIIIVVSYQKEKIINYFGNNFGWTKIKYHHQIENKKWTAWAIIWISIDNIQNDILLINWDSIFEKNDLDKIINLDWYGALVKKVDNPEKYWIFEQNSEWFATQIIEKPKEFVWNLANLWVYKFSNEIINLANNVDLSIRWEYELTDALNWFLENNKFKLIEINWDFVDISYPEDIQKSEQKISNNPNF